MPRTSNPSFWRTGRSDLRRWRIHGAVAQPGRGAHGVPGDAEAAAGDLVVVDVLQAGDSPVVTGLRDDPVAQRLRTGEQCVVAASRMLTL